MSSKAIPGSRFPFGLILLFVLPALASGFMHGPEQQLQGMYAKYAGLSLAALAGATLLTRAFDAVTYPVIGYLSDLTYAKTGTRKHWVVGGALLSAISVWFLYRPPAGVGIVYYSVWAASTYLGWKIAEIPYQAWSYALTRDYKDRARIQAWRAFALIIGGMIFYATPGLAKWLGWSPTADLGFPALHLTAIICAVLVPLIAIVVVWRVPEGEVAPPTRAEQQRYGIAETIRAVVRNDAMMRLLIALVPVSALGGMATGVSFLFLDVYLRLGDNFPTVMLLSAVVTVIGVPFWSVLSVKFERHRVVAASLVLCAVALCGLIFVPPGPAAVPLVMILYPTAIMALLGVVALYPIIGDISDYGRLQTGEDLSGLYTAIFNFVQVSLRTVFSAAAIGLVGWLGFDATATTQSASGAFGIRLIAVVMPAIGLAIAGVLFWTFPLTRARLVEIREQLDAREAAARASET